MSAGTPPREVSEWLEANAPNVLRTQPGFVREIIVGVLGGVLPDARVRKPRPAAVSSPLQLLPMTPSYEVVLDA